MGAHSTLGVTGEEAALRSVLFGERHPLADQHMGFMTEMRDPLAPLRTARVSDEITRPLAEVLIADEMIGSGRAARLTEFRLGASVRGVAVRGAAQDLVPGRGRPQLRKLAPRPHMRSAQTRAHPRPSTPCVPAQ